MYERERNENGSVHAQTHKQSCMHREGERERCTQTHQNLHLSTVGKSDQSFFLLFFLACICMHALVL